MADRTLEIDGLTKHYGDVVALQEMRFEVRSGELFGFVGRNGAGKTTTMRIVLGVLSTDAGEVRWEGAPMTFEARRRIGYMPEERGRYPKVRLAEQLAAAGLDPASVAAEVAQAQVQVQSLQPVDPERTQKALLGIVVGFALYMALGFYGIFVAQGVVEEKATRMVEIVLATVRPSQLLAGKVVGIGFVGLLQLAIVAAATLALVTVTQLVAMPAFGAGAIAGDLVWFVLGFWLYATAYAAAASLVSRQEEVAGVTAPIGVFLVLSYLLVYVVVPDPGSSLSTILSLLPPFAPILMPVRMATGDAAAWEVVMAMALTLATAGVLTWLAGRMYANSVLRVGARVRVMDALRGK